MKKKRIAYILLAAVLLTGCSGKAKDAKPDAQTTASAAEDVESTANPQEEKEQEEKKPELADGEYTVDFDTDSSMFRVSEALDGKGRLTVKDGEMIVHISLGSKKIVNLFPGLAEDAQQDGAAVLEPTVDTVTYSDGATEEVYGFDVPVPALGEEFDLALVGTKGKWYDHKVSVSNPEPYKEDTAETTGTDAWEDGSYTVELTFEGGSGKAKILSPATVSLSQGKATATITWSSPNYDYMIVDGEKYLPVNTEGNSVFEIPVREFDVPLSVIGDTVAMSKPHEVEYTLTFHSGKGREQ